MKLKYLTHLSTYLQLIILYLCCTPNLSAQSWSFQTGLNSSQFRYYNPTYGAEKTFQPDAGLHVSISNENKMVDTLKTNSAFLRKLTYQWGISLNQFNAIGEDQNIPFSYRTTYAKIQLGVGLYSKLGKGYSIYYGSLFHSNKLIIGNQKMGSNVYNLKGNQQFDRMLFQLGYEFKLVKQLNIQTSLFLAYSDSWQLNTIQKEGTQFAINPTSFGFGIQYSILK
jgi:hypothetical protein